MIFRNIIFYSLIIILVFVTNVFASETFTLSAPGKDILVGESFSVTAYVSSPSQAMNAISGVLSISGGASIVGVNKTSSIVDFWTNEPRLSGNQVRFEGVVLNPGYQGQNGNLFTINLKATKEGTVTFSFSEGAILANDGLGSNIIDSLTSKVIRIISETRVTETIPSVAISSPSKIIALPVITDYSNSINSNGIAFIKGKGEPNALTKIVFKDSLAKSLGEQFMTALLSNRTKLGEILLKNNTDGTFEYNSPSNLLAGAYKVTPYLIDSQNQTEKPGFGAEISVSDSSSTKRLVTILNILILAVPLASLFFLIYFLIWYPRLHLKHAKKRLYLKENKELLTEISSNKKDIITDKIE